MNRDELIKLAKYWVIDGAEPPDVFPHRSETAAAILNLHSRSEALAKACRRLEFADKKSCVAWLEALEAYEGGS